MNILYKLSLYKTVLWTALCCIFFSCFSTKAYGDDAEMPIIAYWGVPDFRITEPDFRTFKDCGFSVSIYPYTSLDVLVTACRVANMCGVKVIGRCPELFSAPKKVASTLRNEEGFYGYFIQDEPNLPDLQGLQKVIEQLNEADNTHSLYINLLPLYENTDEWTYSMTKAKNYPAYLRAASVTPCQQISFDHYPILNDGLRETWYHNLEMVRRESLASGKPFWGFALSVPHGSYPQPTMGSLRLQVYSNLAYGAQAIQYFTYWTPGSKKDYDFHDAPISADGHKTKTYPLVQAMNKELKIVSKLFYGAKVISVHHLGNIPEGTTRQTKMPVNISQLKIVGRQGAVISQLEKDGHRYLAIVNKSHEQPLTVRIKARNNTPCHITKALQEERMKTSYTITAGDILLFQLK